MKKKTEGKEGRERKEKEKTKKREGDVRERENITKKMDYEHGR